MSRTEDILDKTKRTEPEAKKWKVVVGIVVGLIIGCVLFYGLFVATEPFVDDMLSGEEINLLFDFYDEKVGYNETAVYFVGNSIMGTAVYTPLVDDILHSAGYDDVYTYNLLSDGETPLLRALQIERMAESKPSLVIYGMNYAFVNPGKWIEERTVLAQGRYELTPELAQLYSEDELDDLTSNLLFYKRGLLLRSTILPNSARTTDNYVKEPYGVDLRQELDKGKSLQSIRDTVSKSNIVISDDMTRHKQALIYNVQTLQNAGIPVIIINMPIHPLLSETISNDSRQNYFNLLNMTGAKWIDMEYEYGDDHFRDTQHTLWTGSEDFSRKMADLIIQELS